MEGLMECGFNLYFGEDGSVISGKYEVGCSPLIIEGKIHIVQYPNFIKCSDGIALMPADGSTLEVGDRV